MRHTYTNPTTTMHYALCTMHSLCASGTPPAPQVGSVTFTIRVENQPQIDIIL